MRLTDSSREILSPFLSSGRSVMDAVAYCVEKAILAHRHEDVEAKIVWLDKARELDAYDKTKSR